MSTDLTLDDVHRVVGQLTLENVALQKQLAALQPAETEAAPETFEDTSSQ